ncbi:MAG: hypothetical protein GY853_03685 [PVC group bacterium]|nr:hypothetical protein [PVC group bacterium]
MQGLTGKLWFKIIAFIVLQTFMFVQADISWAANYRQQKGQGERVVDERDKVSKDALNTQVVLNQPAVPFISFDPGIAPPRSEKLSLIETTIEGLSMAGTNLKTIFGTLKNSGCSVSETGFAAMRQGYPKHEIYKALISAGYDKEEVKTMLGSILQREEEKKSEDESANQKTGPPLDKEKKDADKEASFLDAEQPIPESSEVTALSVGKDPVKIIEKATADNAVMNQTVAFVRLMINEGKRGKELIKTLKKAGLTNERIVMALAQLGFSLDDIVAIFKEADISATEIIQAIHNGFLAFSDKDIYNALLKNGFSDKDIIAAFKTAGVSSEDVLKIATQLSRNMVSVAKAMVEVGFSYADIAKAYLLKAMKWTFDKSVHVVNCAVKAFDAFLTNIGRKFTSKEELAYELIVDDILRTGEVEITGKDVMTSMLAIKNVAQKYGIDMQGYNLTLESLMELNDAAIVHLDGDHWVSLQNIDGDQVSIIDNGEEKTISLTELKIRWDGNTLAINQERTQYQELLDLQMRQIRGGRGWNPFKAIKKIFKAVKNFIVKTVKAIVNITKAVFYTITGNTQKADYYYNRGFQQLSQALNSLINAVVPGKFLQKIFKSIANGLVMFARGMVNQIRGLCMMARGDFKQGFKTYLMGVVQTAVAPLVSLYGMLGEKVGRVVAKVIQWVVRIVAAVLSFVCTKIFGWTGIGMAIGMAIAFVATVITCMVDYDFVQMVQRGDANEIASVMGKIFKAAAISAVIAAVAFCIGGAIQGLGGTASTTGSTIATTVGSIVSTVAKAAITVAKTAMTVAKFVLAPVITVVNVLARAAMTVVTAITKIVMTVVKVIVDGMNHVVRMVTNFLKPMIENLKNSIVNMVKAIKPDAVIQEIGSEVIEEAITKVVKEQIAMYVATKGLDSAGIDDPYVRAGIVGAIGAWAGGDGFKIDAKDVVEGVFIGTTQETIRQQGYKRNWDPLLIESLATVGGTVVGASIGAIQTSRTVYTGTWASRTMDNLKASFGQMVGNIATNAVQRICLENGMDPIATSAISSLAGGLVTGLGNYAVGNSPGGFRRNMGFALVQGINDGFTSAGSMLYKKILVEDLAFTDSQASSMVNGTFGQLKYQMELHNEFGYGKWEGTDDLTFSQKLQLAGTKLGEGGVFSDSLKVLNRNDGLKNDLISAMGLNSGSYSGTAYDKASYIDGFNSKIDSMDYMMNGLDSNIELKADGKYYNSDGSINTYMSRNKAKNEYWNHWKEAKPEIFGQSAGDSNGGQSTNLSFGDAYFETISTRQLSWQNTNARSSLSFITAPIRNSLNVSIYNATRTAYEPRAIMQGAEIIKIADNSAQQKYLANSISPQFNSIIDVNNVTSVAFNSWNHFQTNTAAYFTTISSSVNNKGREVYVFNTGRRVGSNLVCAETPNKQAMESFFKTEEINNLTISPFTSKTLGNFEAQNKEEFIITGAIQQLTKTGIIVDYQLVSMTEGADILLATTINNVDLFTTVASGVQFSSQSLVLKDKNNSTYKTAIDKVSVDLGINESVDKIANQVKLTSAVELCINANGNLSITGESLDELNTELGALENLAKKSKAIDLPGGCVLANTSLEYIETSEGLELIAKETLQKDRNIEYEGLGYTIDTSKGTVQYVYNNKGKITSLLNFDKGYKGVTLKGSDGKSIMIFNGNNVTLSNDKKSFFNSMLVKLNYRKGNELSIRSAEVLAIDDYNLGKVNSFEVMRQGKSLASSSITDSAKDLSTEGKLNYIRLGSDSDSNTIIKAGSVFTIIENEVKFKNNDVLINEGTNSISITGQDRSLMTLNGKESAIILKGSARKFDLTKESVQEQMRQKQGIPTDDTLVEKDTFVLGDGSTVVIYADQDSNSKVLQVFSGNLGTNDKGHRTIDVSFVNENGILETMSMNNDMLRQKVNSNRFINGVQGVYQITSGDQLALVFEFGTGSNMQRKVLDFSLGEDTNGSSVYTLNDCSLNTDTNTINMGGVSFDKTETSLQTAVFYRSEDTSAVQGKTEEMNNDRLDTLNTGITIGGHEAHYQITTDNRNKVVLSYDDKVVMFSKTTQGTVVQAPKNADGLREIGDMVNTAETGEKTIDVITFDDSQVTATINTITLEAEVSQPKSINDIDYSGKKIMVDGVNGRFNKDLPINQNKDELVPRSFELADGTMRECVVLAEADVNAGEFLGKLGGAKIIGLYATKDNQVFMHVQGRQNIVMPEDSSGPSDQSPAYTISKFDIKRKTSNGFRVEGLVEYQLSAVDNKGDFEFNPMAFNPGAQFSVSEKFNKREVIIKNKVLLRGDECVVTSQGVEVENRIDVDFITQSLAVNDKASTIFNQMVRVDVSLHKSEEADANPALMIDNVLSVDGKKIDLDELSGIIVSEGELKAEFQGVKLENGIISLSAKGTGIINTIGQNPGDEEDIGYNLPGITVANSNYKLTQNLGEGFAVWEGLMDFAVMPTGNVKALYEQQGVKGIIADTFEGEVTIAGHKVKKSEQFEVNYAGVTVIPIVQPKTVRNLMSGIGENISADIINSLRQNSGGLFGEDQSITGVMHKINEDLTVVKLDDSNSVFDGVDSLLQNVNVSENAFDIVQVNNVQPLVLIRGDNVSVTYCEIDSKGLPVIIGSSGIDSQQGIISVGIEKAERSFSAFANDNQSYVYNKTSTNDFSLELMPQQGNKNSYYGTLTSKKGVVTGTGVFNKKNASDNPMVASAAISKFTADNLAVTQITPLVQEGKAQGFRIDSISETAVASLSFVPTDRGDALFARHSNKETGNQYEKIFYLSGSKIYPNSKAGNCAYSYIKTFDENNDLNIRIETTDAYRGSKEFQNKVLLVDGTYNKESKDWKYSLNREGIKEENLFINKHEFKALTDTILGEFGAVLGKDLGLDKIKVADIKLEGSGSSKTEKYFGLTAEVSETGFRLYDPRGGYSLSLNEKNIEVGVRGESITLLTRSSDRDESHINEIAVLRESSYHVSTVKDKSAGLIVDDKLVLQRNESGWQLGAEHTGKYEKISKEGSNISFDAADQIFKVLQSDTDINNLEVDLSNLTTSRIAMGVFGNYQKVVSSWNAIYGSEFQKQIYGEVIDNIDFVSKFVGEYSSWGNARKEFFKTTEEGKQIAEEFKELFTKAISQVNISDCPEIKKLIGSPDKDSKDKEFKADLGLFGKYLKEAISSYNTAQSNESNPLVFSQNMALAEKNNKIAGYASLGANTGFRDLVYSSQHKVVSKQLKLSIAQFKEINIIPEKENLSEEAKANYAKFEAFLASFESEEAKADYAKLEAFLTSFENAGTYDATRKPDDSNPIVNDPQVEQLAIKLNSDMEALVVTLENKPVNGEEKDVSLTDVAKISARIQGTTEAKHSIAVINQREAIIYLAEMSEVASKIDKAFDQEVEYWQNQVDTAEEYDYYDEGYSAKQKLAETIRNQHDLKIEVLVKAYEKLQNPDVRLASGEHDISLMTIDFSRSKTFGDSREVYLAINREVYREAGFLHSAKGQTKEFINALNIDKSAVSLTNTQIKAITTESAKTKPYISLCELATKLDTFEVGIVGVIGESQGFLQQNKAILAKYYDYATSKFFPWQEEGQKEEFKQLYEDQIKEHGAIVDLNPFTALLNEIKVNKKVTEKVDERYDDLQAYEHNITMQNNLESVFSDFNKKFEGLKTDFLNARDSFVSEPAFDINGISDISKKLEKTSLGFQIDSFQVKIDKVLFSMGMITSKLNDQIEKSLSKKTVSKMLFTTPSRKMSLQREHNQRMGSLRRNILKLDIRTEVSQQFQDLEVKLKDLSVQLNNAIDSDDIKEVTRQLSIADAKVLSASITMVSEHITQPIAGKFPLRMDSYKFMDTMIEDDKGLKRKGLGQTLTEGFQNISINLVNLQKVLDVSIEMMEQNNTSFDSASFGKALLNVSTPLIDKNIRFANALYESLGVIDQVFATQKNAENWWTQVTSVGQSKGIFERNVGGTVKKALVDIIQKASNLKSFMDTAIDEAVEIYENELIATVDYKPLIKSLPQFGQRAVSKIETAFKGYTRGMVLNLVIVTAVEVIGAVAFTLLTGGFGAGVSGGILAGKWGIRINRAAKMALLFGGMMAATRVSVHNVRKFLKEGSAAFSDYSMLEDFLAPAAQGYQSGKWVGYFMGGVGGMTVKSLKGMLYLGKKELANKTALKIFGRTIIKEGILKHSQQVFIGYFTAGTIAHATYDVIKQGWRDGKTWGAINWKDVAIDAVTFGGESAFLGTLGRTMSTGSGIMHSKMMNKPAIEKITRSDIIGKTYTEGKVLKNFFYTTFPGAKTFGANLLAGDSIKSRAARYLLAERMFSTANVLLDFNIFGKMVVSPSMDIWRGSGGEKVEDKFAYKMLAGFGEGEAGDSWMQGMQFGGSLAFFSKGSEFIEAGWSNMTKKVSMGKTLSRLKMRSYDKLPGTFRQLTSGTIKEAFIEGPIAHMLVNSGIVHPYLAEMLVEFIPGDGGADAALFAKHAGVSTMEAVDMHAVLEMGKNTRINQIVTNKDRLQELATESNIDAEKLGKMSAFDWMTSMNTSTENSSTTYTMSGAFETISKGSITTVSDVVNLHGDNSHGFMKDCGFKMVSMAHGGIVVKDMIKSGSTKDGNLIEDTIMSFTTDDVAYITGKSIMELGLDKDTYSGKTLTQAVEQLNSTGEGRISQNEFLELIGMNNVTLSSIAKLPGFQGMKKSEVAKELGFEKYNPHILFSNDSFLDFMVKTEILPVYKSMENMSDSYRHMALQELGLLTVEGTTIFEQLDQMKQIQQKLEAAGTTIDNASLEQVARAADKNNDLVKMFEGNTEYQYNRVNAARIEIAKDAQGEIITDNATKQAKIRMQVGKESQVLSLTDFNKQIMEFSRIPYATIDIGDGKSRRKIDISKMNPEVLIKNQNGNHQLVITLMDTSVSDLANLGVQGSSEIRVDSNNNAEVFLTTTNGRYYKTGKVLLQDHLVQAGIVDNAQAADQLLQDLFNEGNGFVDRNGVININKLEAVEKAYNATIEKTDSVEIKEQQQQLVNFLQQSMGKTTTFILGNDGNYTVGQKAEILSVLLQTADQGIMQVRFDLEASGLENLTANDIKEAQNVEAKINNEIQGMFGYRRVVLEKGTLNKIVGTDRALLENLVKSGYVSVREIKNVKTYAITRKFVDLKNSDGMEISGVSAEQKNLVFNTLRNEFDSHSQDKSSYTPLIQEGVNQVDAVLNLIINPNTLFRIPTGTGKTYYIFTAAASINKALGRKTVYVVHDLNQFSIQADDESRANWFEYNGMKWATISNGQNNLVGDHHFELNALEANKNGEAQRLQENSDVIIMSADVLSFFENALGKEKGSETTHMQKTWDTIFGNNTMLLFDEADTIFFKQRAQSGEGAKSLTIENKLIQRGVHYEFIGNTLGLWGKINKSDFSETELNQMHDEGYINKDTGNIQYGFVHLVRTSDKSADSRKTLSGALETKLSDIVNKQDSQGQTLLTKPGEQMDHLRSMLTATYTVYNWEGTKIVPQKKASYIEYKQDKQKAEKEGNQVVVTGFMFNQELVDQYKGWVEKQLPGDVKIDDIENPTNISEENKHKVREYRRSLKAVAKVILQVDGIDVGYDPDSGLIRPAPGGVVTPELQLQDPYFAGHTQLLFAEMRDVEQSAITKRYEKELKAQQQKDVKADAEDLKYADNLYKVTVSDWSRVTTIDKSIRRAMASGANICGFTGTYDAVTDMAFQLYGLRHKYMGNKFQYITSISCDDLVKNGVEESAADAVFNDLFQQGYINKDGVVRIEKFYELNNASELQLSTQDTFLQNAVFNTLNNAQEGRINHVYEADNSANALEHVFNDIAAKVIKNGYIMNGMQTFNEGEISKNVVNNFESLFANNLKNFVINKETGAAELTVVVKDQKTEWDVYRIHYDHQIGKIDVEHVKTQDKQGLETTKHKTGKIQKYMENHQNVFFYLNPSASRATDIESVHSWLSEQQAKSMEADDLKSAVRSNLKNYALCDRESTRWMFEQLAGRDRGARNNSGQRDNFVTINGQKIYHDLDVYVVDPAAQSGVNDFAESHEAAISKFRSMLGNADIIAKQKSLYKNMSDLMYSKVAEYVEDLKDTIYREVKEKQNKAASKRQEKKIGWLANTEQQVAILESYLGEYQNTIGVDDKFGVPETAATPQEALQNVVDSFRMFLKEKVVVDEKFGFLSKNIQASLISESKATNSIQLKREIKNHTGGISFGMTLSDTVDLISENITEHDLPIRITEAGSDQNMVFVGKQWSDLETGELSNMTSKQRGMVKKKLINSGHMSVDGIVSSSGVGTATHSANIFKRLGQGMVLKIISNLFKGATGGGDDEKAFALVDILTSNNILSLGRNNFEGVFNQLQSAAELIEKGVVLKDVISEQDIIRSLTSTKPHAFFELLAQNMTSTAIGKDCSGIANKYIKGDRNFSNIEVSAQRLLDRISLYKDGQIDAITFMPMHIGKRFLFEQTKDDKSIDLEKSLSNFVVSTIGSVALIVALTAGNLLRSTFGEITGGLLGMAVFPLYIIVSAGITAASIPVQKIFRDQAGKSALTKLKNAEKGMAATFDSYVAAVRKLGCSSEIKNSMLSLVKPGLKLDTISRAERIRDNLLNVKGLSPKAKGIIDKLTFKELVDFNSISQDKQKVIVNALAENKDKVEELNKAITDVSSQKFSQDRLGLVDVVMDNLSDIKIKVDDKTQRVASTKEKLDLVNWLGGTNYSDVDYFGYVLQKGEIDTKQAETKVREAVDQLMEVVSKETSTEKEEIDKVQARFYLADAYSNKDLIEVMSVVNQEESFAKAGEQLKSAVTESRQIIDEKTSKRLTAKAYLKLISLYAKEDALKGNKQEESVQIRQIKDICAEMEQLADKGGLNRDSVIDAHMVLAQVYADRGWTSEAEAEYNKIINSDANVETKIKALGRQVIILARQNKFDVNGENHVEKTVNKLEELVASSKTDTKGDQFMQMFSAAKKAAVDIIKAFAKGENDFSKFQDEYGFIKVSLAEIIGAETVFNEIKSSVDKYKNGNDANSVPDVIKAVLADKFIEKINPEQKQSMMQLAYWLCGFNADDIQKHESGVQKQQEIISKVNENDSLGNVKQIAEENGLTVDQVVFISNSELSTKLDAGALDKSIKAATDIVGTNEVAGGTISGLALEFKKKQKISTQELFIEMVKKSVPQDLTEKIEEIQKELSPDASLTQVIELSQKLEGTAIADNADLFVANLAVEGIDRKQLDKISDTYNALADIAYGYFDSETTEGSALYLETGKKELSEQIGNLSLENLNAFQSIPEASRKTILKHLAEGKEVDLFTKAVDSFKTEAENGKFTSLGIVMDKLSGITVIAEDGEQTKLLLKDKLSIINWMCGTNITEKIYHSLVKIQSAKAEHQYNVAKEKAASMNDIKGEIKSDVPLPADEVKPEDSAIPTQDKQKVDYLVSDVDIEGMSNQQAIDLIIGRESKLGFSRTRYFIQDIGKKNQVIEVDQKIMNNIGNRARNALAEGNALEITDGNDVKIGDVFLLGNRTFVVIAVDNKNNNVYIAFSEKGRVLGRTLLSRVGSLGKPLQVRFKDVSVLPKGGAIGKIKYIDNKGEIQMADLAGEIRTDAAGEKHLILTIEQTGMEVVIPVIGEVGAELLSKVKNSISISLSKGAMLFDDDQALVKEIESAIATDKPSYIIDKNIYNIHGFGNKNLWAVSKLLINHENKEIPPIALLHEVMEGKDAPQGLNSHTYLRGCGKDLRNVADVLTDSDTDAQTIITKLNSAGKRQVSGEEQKLIQYNVENGYTGKKALYGLQDRIFGEEANNAFTEALTNLKSEISEKVLAEAGIIPLKPSQDILEDQRTEAIDIKGRFVPQTVDSIGKTKGLINAFSFSN